MKRLIVFFGLLTSALISVESQAKDLGLALSGRIGSLGYGVELTKSLTSALNARVGANYFTFDYITTEGTEKIEFDLELKLRSLSVLLDWYPFANGFRLCGGFVYNENEVMVRATPTKIYSIRGRKYTPSDLGHVDGEIDFKRIEPYLGVGFGNAVRKDKKIGLVLDFGVIFQDSPNVHLNATGMIEPTAEQEPLVEENVKDFKFYPMISLGITYKI